MTRALPEKPNAQFLRKQAKQLLKGLRNKSDAQALADAEAFVRRWHPKPERFTGLRDAQLAIARSYGQPDWRTLQNLTERTRIDALSLAEKAAIFVQLGCVQYRGTDAAISYERARRLLQRTPELAAFDFYTAVVAGNCEFVLSSLTQEPALARTPGGALDWLPLVYATYTRVGQAKQRRELLEIVHGLIEHGADPNSVMARDDSYRFTALTGAMGEGEAGVEDQPPHPCAREVAVCLLEAGADPNDSQGLYNTMFTDSSSKWLRLLVEFGLSADHRINWDSSESAPTCFDFLLGHASKSGLLDRTQELIRLGADVNFEDGYEKRPVHTLALTRGHDRVAAMLEANGAVPENLRPADHARIAIAAGNETALAELISNHSELLEHTELLHHALTSDQRQLIWPMLKLGFNINGTDSGGMTLLHKFAWNDQVDDVQRLLELGADPRIRCTYYDSKPLGHAAHNQSMDVVALLADRSDDIFEAVCCARPQRVAALLNRNPELLQRRTEAGHSLLHLVGDWLDDAADTTACETILDDLLVRGLDINTRDHAGETPLDIAVKHGQEERQVLLEARGGLRSK